MAKSGVNVPLKIEIIITFIINRLRIGTHPVLASGEQATSSRTRQRFAHMQNAIGESR